MNDADLLLRMAQELRGAIQHLPPRRAERVANLMNEYDSRIAQPTPGDERAAFEAWARSEGNLYLKRVPENDGPGRYDDPETQMKWHAFLEGWNRSSR